MLLRIQQYDYEIRYKPGRDTNTGVEVEHIDTAQFLPVPDHQLKELKTVILIY